MRLFEVEPCGLGRIIPACAGNAGCVCHRRGVPGDHPRVCGECLAPGSSIASASGSSPRVRGMHDQSHRRRRLPGIIPACAGNATPGPCLNSVGTDHPRVCGECALTPGAPNAVSGSSPRVRGMPKTIGRWRDDRGIIPACAGNADRVRPRQLLQRDHPRVCGECPRTLRPASVRAGSSPRVRGMQPGPSEARPIEGIIPACAGNASRRM